MGHTACMAQAGSQLSQATVDSQSADPLAAQCPSRAQSLAARTPSVTQHAIYHLALWQRRKHRRPCRCARLASRALPVAPHSLGLARIAAVDSAHKVCARRIDGPLLRMGSAEFAVEKTASAAFAADEACRYVAISHSMLQHGAAMWRRIRSR